MSRTLTLVKHARPEKEEGVDSHHWRLSEQGRADTARLADWLQSTDGSPQRYRAIATSPEPKAAETAEILGRAMGLDVLTLEGLGEHDRSNVPMMRTPEFVSAVANFFRRPSQVVLGRESARGALKRFEKAVNELLDRYPHDESGAPGSNDLLIVTHGTVLALWLEAYCEMDGYTVWRQMGLPSAVSVEWPSCRVGRRVDHLPAAT